MGGPGANSVWEEHTSADGTKFFYNKKTQQSTWKKPAELQSPEEKAAEGTKWRVCYSDGGKMYFFDQESQQSVWTVPPDIAKRASEIRGQENGKPSSSEPVPTDGKSLTKPSSTATKVEEKAGATMATSAVSASGGKDGYANKEEAVQTFKSLLKDKSVGQKDKWAQIMQKIIHDPRYQALKTVKERKVILLEYQDELYIEEEETQLAKERKARKMYTEMLETTEWINEKASWKNFKEKMGEDARFLIVEDERDRKEYFWEYVDDLEEKARKMRREKRKENLAKLKTFLSTCKWMTAETTWRVAKDNKIEEADGAKDLDHKDIIDCFDGIVRQLRNEERERKAREKEKRRKTERKMRDNFRNLLNERAMKGEFHSKSNWADVKEILQKDERYSEFAKTENLKITPADIFEDFATDLEERVASPKKHVKVALKSSIGTVNPDSGIEELKEAIKNHKEVRDFSEEEIQLALFEVLAKAKYKAKEKERRMKRYVKELEKDFKKYLARGYADNMKALKSATLEQAVEKCSSKMSGSSAYEKLDQEKIQSSFEKIKEALLNPTKESSKNDEGDGTDAKMDVDEKDSSDKEKSKRKKKKRKKEDDDDDDDERDEEEDEDGKKKKKKKSSKRERKSKKSKKKRRRDDSRSESR